MTRVTGPSFELEVPKSLKRLEIPTLTYFLLDLQNELTPKYPKSAAKAAANTTLPVEPAPANCRWCSRTAAPAPTIASTRKNRPVTSSHSTCSTRMVLCKVTRVAL